MGKTMHEQDLERLDQLCMMHDDFMTVVFADNIPAVELVLHIILERDDLIVTSVQTQDTLKNLYGRSVRLDITAEDHTGKKYNIEIQRDDRGSGVRRARYNSSLIDAEILEVGENTSGLVDTYVIFITEADALAAGLPIYHIDRVIRETGALFNDGSHIIYVNGSYRSETPLGRLMHDFHCRHADDMHYAVLAERVKHLKEDEGGVTSMCKIMEDMRNEAAAEAAAEATIAAKKDVALALIRDRSLPFEKIAEITKLPLAEIEALAAEQSA